MTRCKQLFSVLALVVPVVALLVASPVASSDASAAERYPNLCENSGICVVGPMRDAVEFGDNVCWDGGRVTLMSSSGCAAGSRTFYLAYGYVIDPIESTVFAYSPAMDTCEAGFCVSDLLDPGAQLDEGLACCNQETGVCTVADGMSCGKGTPTWCTKYEPKNDGTVTCHE